MQMSAGVCQRPCCNLIDCPVFWRQRETNRPYFLENNHFVAHCKALSHDGSWDGHHLLLDSAVVRTVANDVTGDRESRQKKETCCAVPFYNAQEPWCPLGHYTIAMQPFMIRHCSSPMSVETVVVGATNKPTPTLAVLVSYQTRELSSDTCSLCSCSGFKQVYVNVTSGDVGVDPVIRGIYDNDHTLYVHHSYSS